MTAARTPKRFVSFGFLAFLPFCGLSLSGCAANGPAVERAGVMQDDTIVGDYLKARFAANQQQLDVAADAYARASKAAPQDALLLRHAFFYELAAGNVSEARALAGRLLKPEYREATVEEDPGESLRQAVAAARAQQSLSLPILTIAVVQMRDGDYSDALETLKAEKDSSYAQSISYLMEAWATYELEGVDAGLAVLDENSGQAFTGFTPLHRALMLEAAGRRDDARTAYDKAAQAYPAEQTLIARAMFIERSRDRDAARQAWRAMVDDGTTLVRAGRLGLIRMGAPIEGETSDMIRAARRDRPEKLVRSGADGAGLALYHFAWASYRQALQEQAAAYRAGFTRMEVLLNTPLAFAQLSAHLNPDFDAAHYLIGGIYQNYEMYAEAVRAYDKVDFGDSFYEYAVTDKATSYVELDETGKALEILTDYVARDAFAVSTSLRLAGLLADEDRHEEAEQTLTTAIRRIEAQPEDQRGNDLWRYYFSRAVLHSDNDDWPSAEADLITAKELSDDEPYVLNYLGYSWVERGENLTEAFAMIETALDQEPNSGAITDSLGWAHYQMGEYETAIGYLERAVMLEPADAVITDHLGDAYWQTGRHNEARYEWRRALTYDPDEKLRAMLEEKLSRPAAIMTDGGDQE